MSRVSPPVAPTSRTTSSRLTASIYCSNLTRSWPLGAPPHQLNQNLGAHLEVLSSMRSKCVSELAWLWPPTSQDHCPPSACPISLYHTLRVHLQSRLIMVSKCNSKFALSNPTCGSPNSLHYGLQVQTIMASLPYEGVFPIPHTCILTINCHVCSVLWDLNLPVSGIESDWMQYTRQDCSPCHLAV